MSLRRGDCTKTGETTMAGFFCESRTQMNSARDSRNVRKTQGQCRKAGSTRVYYFSGNYSKWSTAAKEKLLTVPFTLQT